MTDRTTGRKGARNSEDDDLLVFEFFRRFVADWDAAGRWAVVLWGPWDVPVREISFRIYRYPDVILEWAPILLDTTSSAGEWVRS